MSEPVFRLDFTPQRLEYVMQVLAQRPYAEVAALLAEMQQQLSSQQQTPNAPQPGPGERAQPLRAA